MKYIQKNQDNTFTLKLNESFGAYSGSTTGFTGVYYFNFYHIQSQINSGISLIDVSDKKIVFSKFILESGVTTEMISGQYQVDVYEDSSKTIHITTEYFEFKDVEINNDVIFSQSNDDIIIYK